MKLDQSTRKKLLYTLFGQPELYLFLSFLLFRRINIFADYLYPSFSIDITTLIGVGFLLVIIWELIHTRGRHALQQYMRPVLWLTGIVLWTAFTLFYTPSPHYGYVKTLHVFSLLVVFLYPLVARRFDVTLFLLRYLLLSLLAGAAYLIIYCAATHFGAGNPHVAYLWDIVEHCYLSIGTKLMYAGVIVYAVGQRLFRTTMTPMILFCLISIALLLLAARGPLLVFCVLTFGVALLLRRDEKTALFSMRHPKLLFIAAAVFFMTYVASFWVSFVHVALGRTLMRFNFVLQGLLHGGSYGASGDARLAMLKSGLQLITSDVSSFLFGQGVGSFGLLFTGADIKAFPHNMPVEIIVDSGLIGLALFVGLFASVFFRTPAGRAQKIYWLVIAAGVFEFFIGGSYEAGQTLFALLSLCLIIDRLKQRTVLPQGNASFQQECLENDPSI